MASLVLPFMRAVKEFGLRGTAEKLYMMGTIKFGELKGTDYNGNKFFENIEDYPYGQHRWVEYADIHNFDAAHVDPKWQGWLNHMTDLTPEEENPRLTDIEQTVTAGMKSVPAHLDTHVGLSRYQPEAMHNWSQHRHRGFGMPSLHQTPFEEDKYYKQPAHPLSKDVKKARFGHPDFTLIYDPEKTPQENLEAAPKRHLRPLTKN